MRDERERKEREGRKELEGEEMERVGRGVAEGGEGRWREK